MARQALTPDHLFDRPWRPGRRFAPGGGGGRLRRWAMLGVLLVLCLVIAGYGYITDSRRVRDMAESYLSGLIGGPVKVGAATLSVFEGLRLDDVRVYVDDGGVASDSLLFSAQTFLIKYDPRTMLGGRLEATQIVAQKPQVHLAENRDVGEWNYERLARRRRHAAAPSPGVPGKPRSLPEILLRNARVTISEIRGGQEVARGFMAVDGRLATTPDDADRFAFHLQSRGVSEGLGPYASGSVSLSTGHVAARLMNFEFDRDVRSMLPVDPREWWQRHGLAGAVSMPEINFTPGRNGQREQFKIVTILNGVTLSVRPEEWMGRGEVTRLASLRKSNGVMGALYRYAGANAPATRGAGGLGLSAAPAPAAGSPADRIATHLNPSAITLKNVAGTFVFTNTGIDVKDVSGFIESNGIKINGRIGGYRPDAPISLQLASFDSENLTIPAAPRYLNSLPREVREVYEQFKPQGEARIAIRVERSEPGARPEVSGTAQILDGRFVFERFPYPLRNVTGRIDFGRAPDGTGRMSMHVRGNGLPDGPNRNAVLAIDTFGDEIGPVGTNVCGVNVRISGQNVASEDALRDAFPPDVRQALSNFDAHRTGKYPQYRGDFVTEVVRPVGPNRRWSFDTDITLAGASGALVAFPYPLHDLAGKLRVRSGYVDVLGLQMRHGNGPDAATLAVDGRVAWTTSDGPRGHLPRYTAPGTALSPRVDDAVRTDLAVSVRNMPIDNELLNAIPKERREWVRKLGVSGKLDVDGRIFPGGVPRKDGNAGPDVEWVVGGNREAAPGPVASAAVDGAATSLAPASPAQPPMGYDLRMTIRDGSLRPFGRTFEATGVGATLRLTADDLTIERVTARRRDADLAATGRIDWPRGKVRVVLGGTAKTLALDEALYELLPEPARKAWDEAQPQGTLDAEIAYDSAAHEVVIRSLADAAASGAPASTQPSDPALPPGVRVVLKPRQLAVTLKSTPYRLDNLGGAITILDNRVALADVTGRHGDATITVAGNAVVGSSSVWDLQIGGDKLPVDDELRRALPETLAGLIESIKLTGKVGFNLSRFTYRSIADNPNPDIDIAGTLDLAGGTLDVGVPLADAVGQLKLTEASVRDGHLHQLRGAVDFDTLTMAGRPAKRFRAELFKPEGKSELRLNKLRGDIAGGTMSGDMTLVYPEGDGPSRYALEMVVRDADVKALAWETDDGDVEGHLTASLSLEGSWGDAAARRGRGDVIVSGRQLKRIPLVLGLLQVTNLALPISSPFNEATAVYSLDGSRVIFEQIRLKASNMVMEGNGSLDFGTKRVALTFTTDNPNGLVNIPFIKELWRGARNEMLRIHVRGTITEPEVSARSMGTFWTTVDEVFDAGKKPAPKKKD